jgi:hypothetical protein
VGCSFFLGLLEKTGHDQWTEGDLVLEAVCLKTLSFIGSVQIFA